MNLPLMLQVMTKSSVKRNYKMKQSQVIRSATYFTLVAKPLLLTGLLFKMLLHAL